MHIQIVNFNLRNTAPSEFEKLCVETADQFAAVPGLLFKIYLADPQTNTYGGVYTWQDKAACDAYKSSDLFKSIASHPGLTNITSREFGVLEAPTRVTRGFATRSTAA